MLPLRATCEPLVLLQLGAVPMSVAVRTLGGPVLPPEVMLLSLASTATKGYVNAYGPCCGSRLC